MALSAKEWQVDHPCGYRGFSVNSITGVSGLKREIAKKKIEKTAKGNGFKIEKRIPDLCPKCGAQFETPIVMDETELDDLG